MRVIRAEAMGMCFGVRDAIAITEAITNPTDVTIHGELVHNEQVNRRLADRGFVSHSEVGRAIPETPAVMITAHGVSNRERDSLAAAGKQVIDTTCPLVRRAHDVALQAERDGWHVVIAGKRDHVEVIGLTGDLASYTIVSGLTDVRSLRHKRIAVVCQTTMQPDKAESIIKAMKSENPDSEVRLFDTICRPTRERQNAMKHLLSKCDAIIVIGGEKSNNTLQLVRVAEQNGTPVKRVNDPEDVDVEWASRFNTIGLTAGTSTPDSVIASVADRLAEIVPSAVASTPSNPSFLPRVPDKHVPVSRCNSVHNFISRRQHQ